MLHKGTVLLDVIEQAESFPDSTGYDVYINSPGGFVDIGDSIYDYLISLKKKGKAITTIQNGLIGSIATKLFLAGDRRIADDRYKFWIHNPFLDNVSGDQDQLMKMAQNLAQTEKDLVKFYGEFTSITPEGLDGLMKIETGLTADQCIKFKFATEKKLTPVFNLIKPMKEENGFFAHMAKFFDNKKKGVQPKAAIPNSETKSVIVNVADGGGSFWVEGDVAEGSGAFLLDDAGEPTQEPLSDGEYLLEDGTKVTVNNGLISAVMAAEAKKEEVSPLTLDDVNKAIQDALAKQAEDNKKAMDALKEANNTEILNLKKGLKLGVQPQKAFYKATETETTSLTIPQIMAKKAEERKKQLNKN